jgi:hypothetical protein
MTGAAFDVGQADPAVNPRDARAYCEGRAGALHGLLTTDNPHAAGSPAHAAWVDGYESVGGGVAMPRDGCADLGSFAPAAGSYTYTEGSTATPGAGGITHETGTVLLKINAVDSTGNNHADLLDAAKAGDIITIGTQSAELTASPANVSGAWSVYVDAWPALTSGPYTVTLEPGVAP